MRVDLLDCTGITIAARFLSGHSLKHKRQFQKQRYDPIGRDVLAHSLGGVCARIDFTALSIDNMDIADHGVPRIEGAVVRSKRPSQSNRRFHSSSFAQSAH